MRRLAQIAGLAIAACALGCAAAKPQASDSAPETRVWSQIRGSRFTLTTDLGAASAAHFASELETFAALATRVLGLGRFPDSPLQVFVFSQRADFERFDPAPNQGGFFVSDGSRSYAVISFSEFSEELRQMLFHEFTHYLMSPSALSRAYPLWYAEGLSEMLSAAAWKQGRATVGLPPLRIAQARHSGRWIALDRLLSTSTTAGMTLEDGSLFYAESWALVHYLHTARHTRGVNRYAQMLDYLERVRSGADSRSALEQAFGVTPLDLEAELRQHWADTSRKVSVLHVELARLAPATHAAPRALSQPELDAALLECTAVVRELRRRGTGPFDLPFEVGPPENPFEVQLPELTPSGDE